MLGSCHEGICGTCETVVLDGEVDHRDSVLTEDEKASNETMMICVSRCRPTDSPSTCEDSVTDAIYRRVADPVVVPTDCWYAAAASPWTGALAALRAAGLPVVLFRTVGRAAVGARGPLRPPCLSAERAAHLDGDTVRCGLCGFVYGADGRCVSVPTQAACPIGAQSTRTRCARSDGAGLGLVGEPGRARSTAFPVCRGSPDRLDHRLGGEQEVNAGFLLLHENFADVTKCRSSPRSHRRC